MWSLSLHTVVWALGDCRLQKKVREEHCLVCCSAVYSSKVPLQMSLLPSSSTLMEAMVSVQHWCYSTKLHGVTYKKTVTLMRTSHLTRCSKFQFFITCLPQSSLINVSVMLNNPCRSVGDSI
jgi:hypothetical protein